MKIIRTLSDPKLVNTCHRKLASSTSGGDEFLDIVVQDEITIIEVPPSITGFESWEKENQKRGTAEWLVPSNCDKSSSIFSIT